MSLAMKVTFASFICHHVAMIAKTISMVNMNDVLPMVRAICGIKVCVHVDNFFIAILRLDPLPAVHCFSLRPL